MKIRDQVRAVVREQAGVTPEAVATATGLKLQQCKDALNQMKFLGEMVAQGDGFAFNSEYVPLPRGRAAQQRLKQLGEKVRGNRAELRARGVNRKPGRPLGAANARSEADVLRKHLEPAEGVTSKSQMGLLSSMAARASREAYAELQSLAWHVKATLDLLESMGVVNILDARGKAAWRVHEGAIRFLDAAAGPF